MSSSCSLNRSHVKNESSYFATNYNKGKAVGSNFSADKLDFSADRWTNTPIQKSLYSKHSGRALFKPPYLMTAGFILQTRSQTVKLPKVCVSFFISAPTWQQRAGGVPGGTPAVKARRPSVLGSPRLCLL